MHFGWFSIQQLADFTDYTNINRSKILIVIRTAPYEPFEKRTYIYAKNSVRRTLDGASY